MGNGLAIAVDITAGEDKDPHLRLFAALTVHLDTLRVRLRRYKDPENPPILPGKSFSSVWNIRYTNVSNG
ncbi:MAG: hypothetical protein MK358_14140 [Vicinamibacterales bacterium]|nr:hypothetical protein [Vicinamibacterales bacterium]